MGTGEFFKKYICCLIRQPKRDMTYAWIASLILVFVVFIVAAVSASKASKSDSGIQQHAPAASFTAVWTAIILVVISVLGTTIVRRYQSPIAIGFLLGIIFIMTQQMLILFAIFVERSQIDGQSDTVRSSQEAMAVFSFFLFLIYAAFGLMLAVFRDDVIREEHPSEIPAGQEDYGEQGEMPQYEEDQEGK